MIKRLSHASIYVLDQNSAEDFYVNKLGFELKMKIPVGEDIFWLTVAPKEEPSQEITLMPVNKSDKFDQTSKDVLINLIKNGAFGMGGFETKDVQATYEELKSKGVIFTKPPTEEFYGVEAIFNDDSGNWFSLTQFKEQ